MSGVRTVMGKLASGSNKAIGAKGPINAMIGAADEIGWTMRDPVTFIDQKGELINLTSGSPARLRKLIHHAIAHKLEEQFMAKLIKGGTGTDLEFAGARLRGLNLKPLRRTLASKDVSDSAKNALKRAFTDGIVTAQKLAKIGYAIDPVCPLCKEAQDSVFHRAWECPQRPGRDHQQEEIGQAALAAGKDSWLYTRGFQPHEVDTRTGLTTTVAHKTRDWAKFSPEDGPVYHDGSCVGGNSTHPRAAWAAVQTDTNGKEIKALWGVVDEHMEQSANTAEHVGLINALFEAEPGCEFVTDCATISQAWSKGMKYAAAAKRPHGGVWREASQLIHSGKGPSGIRKCKAHQNISVLEGDEKVTALGNDAADKRAKAALSENDLRGDIRKKVIETNDWAGKVAGELGKRLAEWPTTHQLFGELEKTRLPIDNKVKAQKKQHCFSHVEGQIRCTLCNFLPRKGDVNHRECDGFPKAIVEAIKRSQANGHRLKAAGGEGRLCSFWCTKCGSHARTVPRGLAKRCSGVPTKAGAWALQLTRQGRDPLDGNAFEFHYEIGAVDGQ